MRPKRYEILDVLERMYAFKVSMENERSERPYDSMALLSAPFLLGCFIEGYFCLVA